MEPVACSRNLTRQGWGYPKFLIDRSRLLANAERVAAIAAGDRLRLVLKSLPCPALVDQLIAVTGSNKLMVFHLPFLIQACQRWPDADIMLGKPLPQAAVRTFFEWMQTPGTGQRSGALHWLVDTPQRVADYDRAAADFDRRMNVVVELDVGMHRGGAGDQAGLKAILAAVARSEGRLAVTGFMGYDAHAGQGVPWLSRSRAVARANRRYSQLIDVARSSYPELLPDPLMINGSGSPTCRFHDADSPLNELAIGSAFLKPAEFDLPQLADFQPACWLAAPVLKRLSGVRIPFLESLQRFSRRDTVFVYGGRWPARPAWPQGLRGSALYGPSFNQQFYTIPRGSALAVDDFVFFRPLQSEAVMLAFGDVLLIDDDEVRETWPVLSQRRPERFLNGGAG